MSDTNETPAATETAAKPRERTKPAEKKIMAKLVRGANYAVRHAGKIYRFKGGVEVGPIPASLKARLEETAADGVTVTEGDDTATTEMRQKFQFREV